MTTVTETSAYHHSTGSIADALQRIVDGLRAAGDTPIAQTHLGLGLQVTCHSDMAPEVERRAAVDVLGAAIAPDEPRADRVLGTDDVFYYVGGYSLKVGGVAIDIYAPDMAKADADAEVQA